MTGYRTWLTLAIAVALITLPYAIHGNVPGCSAIALWSNNNVGLFHCLGTITWSQGSVIGFNLYGAAVPLVAVALLVGLQMKPKGVVTITLGVAFMASAAILIAASHLAPDGSVEFGKQFLVVPTVLVPTAIAIQATAAS